MGKRDAQTVPVSLYYKWLKRNRILKCEKRGMFKFGSLLFFLLAKVKSEIEGEISVFLVPRVYIDSLLMIRSKIMIPKISTRNLEKVCTDACTCFYHQIDEDLKIWSNGINQDDFERASGITNTVHYQIIDGHIYRSEWFSNMLPFWSTLACKI